MMHRLPASLFIAIATLTLAFPCFAELGIQPVTRDVDEYRRYNPEDRYVDPGSVDQNSQYGQGLNALDDDFNAAVDVLNDGRQEDYNAEVDRRLQAEIDNVNAGGWRPVTTVMDKFIEAKIPEATSEYAIKP